MKRFLLSLFTLFSFIQGYAQVSYGDIAWGTYNMKINITTSNDSIFLNIIYTDENKKITESPKLLIRLMNDEVISLEGILLGSHNKSDGGIVLSGVYISSHHFVSEAKFLVSKEQIEMFEKGIKKLRLNTSPKYHEKEWKKDKIGRKLFTKYKECSSNSFQDDF